MPDFRSVHVKPAAPNGTPAPNPTQKAIDVLAKIEAKVEPPVKTETPAPTPGAATATPAPVPGEKPAAGAEEERFNRAVVHERRLQQERLAIKAEREKLEAERKEMESLRLRPAEYQKDPRRVLADAFPGMDPIKAYELLTKTIIDDGKVPPELAVHAVEQKVTDLETRMAKEREEAKAAEKKAQEESYAQAVADVKSDIGEHLKASTAAYPFFLAGLEGEADAAGHVMKPEEYVYSVMDAVYQKDLEHPEVKERKREPTILTYEEAAKKCEAFFKAKYERLAKLAAAPARPAATPSLAAAPSPSPGAAPRRRTPADRLAAAIAVIPD